MSEDRWTQLRPVINLALVDRSSEVGRDLPLFFSPHLRIPEMPAGILLRLLRRTPGELFDRSDQAISTWFADGVDAHLVEEVFETIYRHMAISDVVFRNTNIIEEERIAGEDCTWEVVSGDARIQHRSEGSPRTETEIRYVFDKENRSVLGSILPLEMPENDVDKIIIGYRGDRSWHEVWATVEMGGKRCRSVQPAFLNSGRWQETTWRFDRGEPRQLNMRTWLRLKKEGPPEFDEFGKIRITLEVRYCSRFKASLNKLVNNYREVLRMVPVPIFIKNGAILVSLNILGQVLASSMVAFAFARLRWPTRDFCFLLMLATLMIPTQVTLIPQFLIFKSLGWYNTLKPHWTGAFFGSAFYIFLLRQFMRGIPTDLEDSARIDGCGHFGIYWRIILPLIKPALATIGIFTFLGTWNDFMGPLICLNHQRLYPLSMGVFPLQVFQAGNCGLMMAASVLMTVPVSVLFFLAQRQFIQGITLTGLKG